MTVAAMESALMRYLRPKANNLLDAAARAQGTNAADDCLYALTIELVRTIKVAAKRRRVHPSARSLRQSVGAGISVTPERYYRSSSGWVFEASDRAGRRLALKSHDIACIEDVLALLEVACRWLHSAAPPNSSWASDVEHWLRAMMKADIDVDREREILLRVEFDLRPILGIEIANLVGASWPPGTLLLRWCDGTEVRKWSSLPSATRGEVARKLLQVHEALREDIGIVRFDTHPSNIRIAGNKVIQLFDWSNVLQCTSMATPLEQRLASAAIRDVEAFLTAIS